MPQPVEVSSLVALAAKGSHDMVAAVEAVQTLTALFDRDDSSRLEALHCNIVEALLDIVRYAPSSLEAVKAVLQCLDRLSVESQRLSPCLTSSLTSGVCISCLCERGGLELVLNAYRNISVTDIDEGDANDLNNAGDLYIPASLPRHKDALQPET